MYFSNIDKFIFYNLSTFLDYKDHYKLALLNNYNADLYNSFFFNISPEKVLPKLYIKKDLKYIKFYNLISVIDFLFFIKYNTQNIIYLSILYDDTNFIIKNYIQSLLCSMNNLQYLKTDFLSLSDNLIYLTFLDIHNLNIDNIPNTYINLEYLDCSCSSVRKIPDEFTDLIYLNCNNTKVDSLPNNIKKIKYLNVTDTNIKLDNFYEKYIKKTIYISNYKCICKKY